MSKVISISTFWGTRYGGVNSFNYRFIEALAKAYPSDSFVNISIEATEGLDRRVLPENLEIVSLERSAPYLDALDGQLSAPDQSEISRRVQQHAQLGDHIVLVGHDVYTGRMAIDAAEGLRSGGWEDVRTAVIRHVDFTDYQPLDTSRSQKSIVSQNRLQLDILKAASFVFAIGPILHRSTQPVALKGRLSELTPGVSRSGLNPQHEFLSLAAFGRFDQKHDYVKQSSIIAPAFGQFLASVHQIGIRGDKFWREAKLTLIGVEEARAAEISRQIGSIVGSNVNVFPVPFIDDPDQLVELMMSRGVNVGVVPSLRESFGLVALEFIGNGIPLILSTSTGVYQWLEALHGGEGVGCITPLSVNGSANPDVPNAADVAALRVCIEEIGAKIVRKISDADRLRRRLLAHSWQETALQFGTAMGLRQHREGAEFESRANEIALFQAQFETRISAKIAETRRSEITEALDRYVSTGRYRSAEIELEKLRRTKRSPSREVRLYEIELSVRTGSYLEGIRSIDEHSRLIAGHDRLSDWDETDLKMESLRNISLRDLGRYGEAVDQARNLVQWAEAWLQRTEEPAERVKRTGMLASALRKQARSLAFIGDEEGALAALQKARDLAGQDGPAQSGKWHFGRGEIYRHSGSYFASLSEYTASIESAQQLPDLDLYAWGCLCLSDSYFMLGQPDEASSTLVLAMNAISLFGEELPVESTHIRLSELALRWSAGERDATDQELSTLVDQYKKRRIEWVDVYFDALKRTGRPPFAKRF